MKTIHKFQISFDEYSIYLPRGAYPVHFAFQDNKPHIWVELDTSQIQDKLCAFQIFPTGAKIPPYAVHQFTTIEGQFVWHLYAVS